MIETVLQALRAWVVTATGLPSERVIPADDVGPRPAAPYVVIAVRTVATVGTPEHREHATGRRWVAVRAATVEVTAIGVGGDAYPDLLEAALEVGTVQAALTVAGVTVGAPGPARLVSLPVDTAIEPRWLQEWAITWGATASPVAGVAFDTASIAMTYDGPEVPDLTDTITT